MRGASLGRYRCSPSCGRYLEEVLEQAEPGTEYVITRYRNGNANLRTQLQRIIRKAGLKPWPKLFQNLRSTQRNGTGGEPPDARRLRLDRQQPSRGGQALPASAGRRLSTGHRKAAQNPPPGAVYKGEAAQNPAHKMGKLRRRNRRSQRPPILANCAKKRTKPWKAKACGKWRQSLAKRGQAAKCPL